MTRDAADAALLLDVISGAGLRATGRQLGPAAGPSRTALARRGAGAADRLLAVASADRSRCARRSRRRYGGRWSGSPDWARTSRRPTPTSPTRWTPSTPCGSAARPGWSSPRAASSGSCWTRGCGRSARPGRAVQRAGLPGGRGRPDGAGPADGPLPRRRTTCWSRRPCRSRRSRRARRCRRGSGHRRWTGWTPFTYPFNMTQQPAATVPCGLDGDGLPIGVQLVGRAARGRAGPAGGARAVRGGSGGDPRAAVTLARRKLSVSPSAPDAPQVLAGLGHRVQAVDHLAPDDARHPAPSPFSSRLLRS